MKLYSGVSKRGGSNYVWNIASSHGTGALLTATLALMVAKTRILARELERAGLGGGRGCKYVFAEAERRHFILIIA